MTEPSAFLSGKVMLHAGDCLAVLPTLAENSIDSCVTDPPYHLTSIVRRFGRTSQQDETQTSDRSRRGADGYARLSTGFMGKQWDGGDIAFNPETWRAVYRVLKPGAHLLACGGTRTYHRLAAAIEDAGFEIRDCVQWLYGSGFPKSHDVSKGIDKAAGAERKILSEIPAFGIGGNGCLGGHAEGATMKIDAGPATPQAAQWQGWGTALKPACELIVMARKPLSEKTVAANVLKWETGALNIDGCRVETDPRVDDPRLGGNGEWHIKREQTKNTVSLPPASMGSSPLGRWPANVIHDGSDEVVGMFPESGPPCGSAKKSESQGWIAGSPKAQAGSNSAYVGDSGSAARFFYTAKADSNDRIGSKHPTVKPLDLIQYLIRLITPSGGLVLDPFAGTGTTGEAAFREGMRTVLIEREAEYQADIRRRMALVLAGPDERARESIKAKLKDKPVDHGPLFADDYNADDDIRKSVQVGLQAVKERMAAGGPAWPKGDE